jgi:hypothetical protein
VVGEWSYDGPLDDSTSTYWCPFCSKSINEIRTSPWHRVWSRSEACRLDLATQDFALERLSDLWWYVCEDCCKRKGWVW